MATAEVMAGEGTVAAWVAAWVVLVAAMEREEEMVEPVATAEAFEDELRSQHGQRGQCLRMPR